LVNKETKKALIRAQGRTRDHLLHEPKSADWADEVVQNLPVVSAMLQVILMLRSAATACL